MRRVPTILWLPALAAALQVGCAQQRPASVAELFAAIEPGMPRAVVEAKLGAPVAEHAPVLPPLVGECEVWYLPPPTLRPIDSPWGPGSIRIGYSADGRVSDKQLNPQADREGQPRGAADPEAR